MSAASSFLRGTVAKRILVLFLVCALLPVGSLAVLSLREMSGKLKEQAERQLRHDAKNVNMGILQGLFSVQTELKALVSATGPRGNAGPVPADRHFRGLTLFRERSGPETIFGTTCPRPPRTEGLFGHLSSGEAAIFVREVPGKPSHVYMAVSVPRTRQDRGFAVGEIDPQYLKEMVKELSPANGAVTVLDSTGAPLYSSRPLPPGIARRVRDDLRKRHAGRFEWKGRDGAILFGYRSIYLGPAYHSGDWTVVVSRSKASAFAPMRAFTRMFLLIVALTLLVVSLLSIVQIRRNLVPLARLREGTRRIGEGDFTGWIEVKSGDEFEELARSFNAMTARLGKEFHALNETGRIVRTVLTGLEREKIIDTILSNLPSVVPCAAVFLSLMGSGDDGTAQTFAAGSGTGDSADSRRHPAVITPEEMRKLESTEESLIVEAGREFRGLLSPPATDGMIRFVLLPLVHKGNLAGVLILGYEKGSREATEDLVRARQIADEVAVALANAGLIEELARVTWGTMTALARAVDAKSSWTAGHSERVTELSLMLGGEMGLSTHELDVLHRGGLLHDIGKIGVPGRILDKPGKLTPEEFDVIREHPGKGGRILEPIPAFREVLPLVIQHHEAFDGTGYPRGISGEAISLGARILAVADVYDALVSPRPYRSAWAENDVRAYIEENAGRKFDPAVVRVFRKVMAGRDAAVPTGAAAPVRLVGGVASGKRRTPGPPKLVNS